MFVGFINYFCKELLIGFGRINVLFLTKNTGKTVLVVKTLIKQQKYYFTSPLQVNQTCPWVSSDFILEGKCSLKSLKTSELSVTYECSTVIVNKCLLFRC